MERARAIRMLVESLAARGEAILVGRGAGYYLPPEMSLHVRIVAPLDDRIAHMADTQVADLKELLGWIDEIIGVKK